MAHQVIARKWRPQRFQDVIGQQHITKTLQYAIKTNRVAHVYLFTGIRGTGKTTLARIFAKALNCEHRLEEIEPCNVCSNCIETTEGKNPDVVEIDGASNNSVDNIRELRDNINYGPLKSKYKIYIIDEVHMLSKSAFNALLKTLEEPPAHTIFILATTDPEKIIPTVLSRCQRYDLKRLSTDDIINHLATILEKENIEFEKSALHLIAREGEGSMRDSQTALEQIVSFGSGKITEDEVAMLLGNSKMSVIRKIIEAVISKDSKTAIELANDIFYSGKSVEKASKDILFTLHNILLFSELKDTSFLDSSLDEKKWIEAVAKRASVPDWNRFFRFWNDEYVKIKTSEFAYMLFEVALITASSFPKMEDFSKLLKLLSESSIEELEAKMDEKIEKIEKNPPELQKNSVIREKKEIVEEKSKAILVEQKDIPKNEEKIEDKDVKPEKQPEKTETSLQKTEEIEKTQEQKEEILTWETFVESVKTKNTSIYGMLFNLQVEEQENQITIHITDIKKDFIKDDEDKIKQYFDDYFKNQKTLEIKHPKTSESDSISQKKQKEKEEKIAKIKQEIKKSKIVKDFEQLGFELKTIKVNLSEKN